ncbi:MAG: 4-hydroxy-3-methylbut-2-enyl diphosphate reductase [Candidatus Curtissbacteria bacterium GW2011_GWA1_40_47]|uniref:4-hydroxy-3-methylbut-2-enyl diphosphate reductase n=1 Tax=Candidatus Curtissbacteria bacterium RIFOXYA1_FULL_41_14 TaxID=1797737 RepID=A0A1F5HG58_9BACT|nr:MAG: ispH, 4-hydroxy-3-methylbut-2-enyl diphosphate reductase, 4-hydroxy-3-methylbut-2-enyl diphosphate reductase [Microgenomates group bacterium GW2011_GWC1_40_35]KKR65753.1 MAG: 4-hydroxy-3-methylbut-2-enyl diphosphate reductase [Candidatus Curtissbacteria bacterium GW2011_GWA1_40_47]OGD79942.1 MAG: 4-hydroxy-3-methylbut-2-enyl diphosphate reductase [Candidatus Curtissbacteria bacterium RIFCSPHIGHO2_01_FULL_34_40]OGE03137.1 MAG: 4-hydroxy-3-methylbut-2-enyl diphosphate reductase [Candidatus
MIQKILLAKPRGFCAGVDRAIDVVEAALEIFGGPIYVKHAIVHNTHVVSDLEKKGAIFVENLDEIPNPPAGGSIVIFSAHGTDPQVKEEAKKRGHRVVDATCPLVTKVHLEAQRYVREGYHVIYIGHRGHPEPIGVFGEVSEGTISLIENADEVKSLKVPQREKLVFLTQTTLSVSDTNETIQRLKMRFPKIISAPSSDICYATTNRQAAARRLARLSDLVLVLGSKASSNSKRLVEVCKEEGVKAYLVDDEKMVNPKWLVGVRTLGITSGASAPEHLVTRLVDFIKTGNPDVEVENLDVIKEEVKFPLPDDLVTLAQEEGKGALWVEKHRVATQR